MIVPCGVDRNFSLTINKILQDPGNLESWNILCGYVSKFGMGKCLSDIKMVLQSNDQQELLVLKEEIEQWKKDIHEHMKDSVGKPF